MSSILIVEDDVTFSLMLSTWLKRKSFDVQTTSSIQKAKEFILHQNFHIILSDLRLPDGDGIAFLRWMNDQKIHLPFIIMTSYAEIETAVQSIKMGASDYIAKPLNPEDLLKKIKDLIHTETEKMSEENDQQTVPVIENKAYIEGQSPMARLLYEHIHLVAPTDMSVLITGSSGTGKEYIARRIHEESRRKSAPFIAVDCGAIPKDLAASEFFGHVKGSFTGAIDNKKGAFEVAQGGTIFLDEIGNLTYEVQVQLLRALQERKIKQIGSNHEIAIDVRLISATNENLRQAIEKGEFREDLYHRINEFNVRIPDLKERKEDILLFANHFLDLANQELQKNIIGFDAHVIRKFFTYSWPGNLRQMKNVVKYATLLATGEYITLENLPEELNEEENGNVQTVLHLKDEEHECLLIKQALKEVGNNKSKAARLLGIDRKTLYNKLKIYKIE